MPWRNCWAAAARGEVDRVEARRARADRAAQRGWAPRLGPIERAPPVGRAPRPRPHGVLVVFDSPARLRDPLGRTIIAPSDRSRAMSGAWDRDEAGAFVETLFAKHHGEIYAYLMRMMRDPEMAADMTQDAFVKAYKNYASLEKPENARAWLD